MWITTVEREGAGDDLAELYDGATRPGRPVSDRVKVFGLRPDVLAADLGMRNVVGLPKDGLSLGARRAEMISTAVSGMNGCAYCGVWHSRTLVKDGGVSESDALSCYQDWRQLDLGDADRTMMLFVEKLTFNPGEMSEDDVVELRNHGFSDLNIFDIVMLCSYRNYLTRILNALGVPVEALEEVHGVDVVGTYVNATSGPATTA
ncbi:carboxymuconolactone decarboxylase family protein [Nocardia gipuzkoensis]|uniref:carboxymuconolactone decarboxylase family protein n=1 Tax=Nocardia gipuzkoensis TaxID=2749991 RepID=UPI00237EADB3|nr:peroxidase-related enzyme [Nocardia gipuzkoensis]MDE1675479.1 peroxidase-related enzyme [Nocardia gipuzkoensis]